MKKVFITGGTGFIGSHLCHHLANQGYELVLLIRDHKERQNIAGRPALPDRVQKIVGDLFQPTTYLDALQGCDAVVHLAADYRVGLPNRINEREQMYATNVHGTLAVAEAVRQAKVPRFVYASTTAAFGETFGSFPDETHLHNSIFRCYYEETKHIAHRLLKQHQEAGLPVTMAILGGVFGAGDNASLTLAMKDFLNDKLPVLPDSQSRFQLCHVSHVCKAFELLLAHPEPDAAYLFTGQDFSMTELIGTLARITNKPQPKKIAVNKLKLPALIMDGLSRFGLNFPLSKEVIQIMDGSTYMYSSAKAINELGWSAGNPQQELEAYMQALIDGKLHELKN